MGEINQKWHSAFAHLSKVAQHKSGNWRRQLPAASSAEAAESTAKYLAPSHKTVFWHKVSEWFYRVRGRGRDTLSHSLIFITNVRFLELSSVVEATQITCSTRLSCAFQLAACKSPSWSLRWAETEVEAEVVSHSGRRQAVLIIPQSAARPEREKAKEGCTIFTPQLQQLILLSDNWKSVETPDCGPNTSARRHEAHAHASHVASSLSVPLSACLWIVVCCPLSVNFLWKFCGSSDCRRICRQVTHFSSHCLPAKIRSCVFHFPDIFRLLCGYSVCVRCARERFPMTMMMRIVLANCQCDSSSDCCCQRLLLLWLTMSVRNNALISCKVLADYQPKLGLSYLRLTATH